MEQSLIFGNSGAFRDDGLPPQATQVDLGSDTKLLTATLVLKQIETGGLDLDATLGGLLDGVPADKQAITLRQVLTRRAGFPDDIVYKHSGANLAFSAKWRFHPDLQLLIFIAGWEDQALDAVDLAIDSVAELRSG